MTPVYRGNQDVCNTETLLLKDSHGFSCTSFLSYKSEDNDPALLTSQAGYETLYVKVAYEIPNIQMKILWCIRSNI